MSIYSNVTEQDLDNLRKLAQQQKNQRALKIKNRILKQTHDEKLAESLSPITKRLDLIENNKGEKIGDLIKKSETPAIEDKPQSAIEDEITQTPTVENINISRQLLDTLALMKSKKNFFKLTEDDNSKVYWNGVLINPLGDNRISIKNQEYDITPDFQAYFTNTKHTTRILDDIEKETVYDILQDVGFYDNIPHVGLKAARMQDALHILPNEIKRIREPALPAIENDLQGEGVKIIIPSNLIDIYSRLEILLGLKLSGHTDTLTEASNLIDELYRRGEIQNKQQYRNALDKFLTH